MTHHILLVSSQYINKKIYILNKKKVDVDEETLLKYIL